MKFANRVLLCALAIFVLSGIASAQTPRNETDPRNQSPSVGTGGPVGGPTGLFTIYDGDTLRRGEFTFSVAMSNYDRDPGDLDITDYVASVNVGLNDHLELFFSTTGYRGIKANSPLNLSGFYLPNSQVFFSSTALGSPPAIVIAPGQLGSASGAAIFRPPFCLACVSTAPVPGGFYRWGQPFVGYPFSGGTGPNFGEGPGGLGTLFGFPGFTTTILGAPVLGSGGNFGAASAYPGVGAPVGGILPGIVLATATLPATILTNPIVVPVTFTTRPSYYPGAPFLNRLYGESSFDDFTAGVKWRITGPNNPFGFGFIPFYRWYPDKGKDASGFNMLERGAGTGGNVGDFGLVMFASGRLSRSVNLSANLGYILHSNPKGPAGDTLLDIPDEVIAGVGFDFPVNKHFQPVLEFRSTQYVAGRTPNAFGNNPVEFTGGIKIFPKRWWGLAAWYRMHLNQQSQGHFNGADASTNITQVTNVVVPGRGLVPIASTSRPATAGSAPLGFRFSDNPHGYGAQLWFGHRNAREPAILPNQPPVVSLAASTATITLPCPEGTTSATCPTGASMSTALTATATDPDGDTLLYTWTVTGGRVTGDGANVSWDLSGVGPGSYTATVEVDDGCGCVSFSSTTVTVASCTDCRPILVCPTVNVSCASDVDQGAPATFTANVGSGTPPVSPTYNWSVSAGTITSGQGTSSITVSTDNLGGQTVTATVELGGLDPSCGRTASCSTAVRGPAPSCRKFDEYGNIRFNDEKARLDNFAIQLQNEPTAQGYIIGYGSCDAEGQTRANRAKDYLVNTRGIDAGRLVVVDGGCMPELKVELWVCPSGATAPAAETTGAVSPCPDCKTPKRRVRRGRRGEE